MIIVTELVVAVDDTDDNDKDCHPMQGDPEIVILIADSYSNSV